MIRDHHFLEVSRVLTLAERAFFFGRRDTSLRRRTKGLVPTSTLHASFEIVVNFDHCHSCCARAPAQSAPLSSLAVGER